MADAELWMVISIVEDEVTHQMSHLFECRSCSLELYMCLHIGCMITIVQSHMMQHKIKATTELNEFEAQVMRDLDNLHVQEEGS